MLAVGAAVLALSACGAEAHPYSDLGGEATRQDALPASLPEYASRDLDIESSRYVGDDDGTRLWLARGAEEGTVCLVIVSAAEEWFVACGGEAGPMTTGGVVGSYTVHADHHPIPDDAVEISANVYRR